MGTIFTPPAKPAAPAVPVISEWHRTVLPGESFVLSGGNFTLRGGSDTQVHVLAGGRVQSCRIHHVESNNIIASLPAGIPFGMYLIWVENAAGTGQPVALNRARPEWIGPLGSSARPGQEKRVFGRNLSREHGTEAAYVYLRPTGGNFPLRPVQVTGVEPYAVKFIVPGDLPEGDYHLYVHNGHGGEYGFGGTGDAKSGDRPLTLTVKARAWERGERDIKLSPSGGDDTEALRQAIDSLSAEPNGGTLRLAAGEFIITRQLSIKDKVAVIGAGMDKTVLGLRFASEQHSGITLQGNNILIQDFAVKLHHTEKTLRYSILSSWWQTGGTDDLTVRNIKWSSDPQAIGGGVGFTGKRVEITGVVAERPIQLIGQDHWMHDNLIHGGPYWGQAEAGLTGSMDGTVVEKNRFDNKNWPTGPAGSRNYRDFMDKEELHRTIWLKRMMTVGPMRNSYIAHNVAVNAATQDNKGEMILFHEAPGVWFGTVEKSEGTKVLLSAKTEIFGKPVVLHHGSEPRYKAGGPVPAMKFGPERGFWDREPHLVIVRGRGFGQSRLITAQKGSEMTIEYPWRISPDASSVAVITPLYKENIIYRNDLSAFPEGYVLDSHSASNGIQYDGNSWMNVAEGNISRRTSSGRRIGGRNLAPSYWNEFRDETAEDVLFSMGFAVMTGGDVFSPASFANAFRGGRVQMRNPYRSLFNVHTWFTGGKTPGGTPENPWYHNLANIFEGVKGQARAQWLLEGASSPPEVKDQPLHRSLYRGNTVTLDVPQREPEPVAWQDFRMAFQVRRGAETPGNLMTIGLRELESDFQIGLEADAGGNLFYVLPGTGRLPAGEDWLAIVIERRGAEVSFTAGGHTHKTPVNPTAVCGGVRFWNIRQPFYMRDFSVADMEGKVLFADSLRGYRVGGKAGEIFQVNGWSGHMWGEGRQGRAAPGESEFMLKGHDFGVYLKHPHFDMPPESLPQYSAPIKVDNSVSEAFK